MHISVLKNEIIENLDVQSNGIYFDLTLGAGGHASEIWAQLDSGMLVVFDLEREALERFLRQLAPDSIIVDNLAQSGTTWSNMALTKIEIEEKTLVLANQNFSTVAAVAEELEVKGKVNGIIADLGWSSEQLERIPGLAFSKESNLDMRFDSSLQVKASDLLNALHAGELTRIFAEYSDLVGGHSRKLIDAIIERRKYKPFETTTDLLQTINSVLPRATHRGSHYSADSRSRENVQTSSLSDHRVVDSDFTARVFQALRIAVNNELSALQSMLENAKSVLQAVSQPGTPDLRGRLLVISFHSGEDRIIKDTFAKWVASGSAEYLADAEPIRPGVEELRQNMRARSAKLRMIRIRS